MTKLSVNVNKIATLRNTRPSLNIPDLVKLSEIAIEAGAEGITIHPRPDQRHIRDEDVAALSVLLQRYPGIEFNIEGNPFEGKYVEHCATVRPHQCTLVPDTVEQSTSDHGWQFPTDLDRLKPVVRQLKSFGCRVSLFMDPLADQMQFVRSAGADRVELYTEPFAARYAKSEATACDDYRVASEAAHAEGLAVNAGHDLNLLNLGEFLDRVPYIAEVSIGHALIADALEYGLAEAIKRYLAITELHAN
jgi:pyridoxine 5-phosphate synthase